MATVQELINYLQQGIQENKLKPNDKVMACYDESNELECGIFSEQEVIGMANRQAGSFGVNIIEDLDSALTYLADESDYLHFMDIKV